MCRVYTSKKLSADAMFKNEISPSKSKFVFEFVTPKILKVNKMWVQNGYSSHHRRRIELEEKANVVALDWGTESLPWNS